MKTVKRALIFGVMLSLVSWGAASIFFGFNSESSRKTLRGISALNVVVENLGNDIDPDGTLKTHMQTDVELKLRLAGITVNQVLEPFLYVNCNILKLETGMYVYGCNVELLQGLILPRDGKSYLATTWSTSYTGTAKSYDRIRSTVKDKVDEFINAYLPVNPKK